MYSYSWWQIGAYTMIGMVYLLSTWLRFKYNLCLKGREFAFAMYGKIRGITKSSSVNSILNANWAAQSSVYKKIAKFSEISLKTRLQRDSIATLWLCPKREKGKKQSGV